MQDLNSAKKTHIGQERHLEIFIENHKTISLKTFKTIFMTFFFCFKLCNSNIGTLDFLSCSMLTNLTSAFDHSFKPLHTGRVFQQVLVHELKRP